MDWLQRFDWDETDSPYGIRRWENGYGDILYLDDRLEDRGQTDLDDFHEPRYRLTVTSSKSTYQRHLTDRLYSRQDILDQAADLMDEDTL